MFYELNRALGNFEHYCESKTGLSSELRIFSIGSSGSIMDWFYMGDLI